MEYSSIKALNTGISSHNPFVGAETVREPDVWNDRPADSPRLNAEVRSHFHAAYDRVCRGETVAAVTILGETGTGKTHELNCLRHHIHTASTPGLFVYLNVQQFSDSHTVRQQLLRAVCDSFTRRMPSGLLQWQQLAIAFANHALRGLENSRKQFVPQSVIDMLSRNSLEQNQSWIDRIAESFFRVRPEIDDPDLIRAVFWTLCPHQLPYARKWLSGQSLPAWKCDELGLAATAGGSLESQAWRMLLNLLAAIEHYAPMAIVFDHFEYPELPEPNVPKDRVAMGTIKWLSERMRTRSRRFGVLFACAMHPETWELVQQHSGSLVRWAHDRGNPCELKAADAATIEVAIACWLSAFYVARQLVPPTSLYPFDRAQIDALVRESLDLHDAIEWCADNFQPVEADPLEPIELRFGEIVRELGESGLGDDRAIGRAIGRAFAYLQDCELTVSPSEASESSHEAAIPACIRRVVPLPDKAQAFSVAIDLDVAGQPRRLALRVLSSTNGRQLCAQIDRCLHALDSGEIASPAASGDAPAENVGCLLRPLGAAIPPRWKAATRYATFAEHPQGATLGFSLDDIAPLLALVQLEAEIEAQSSPEIEPAPPLEPSPDTPLAPARDELTDAMNLAQDAIGRTLAPRVTSDIPSDIPPDLLPPESSPESSPELPSSLSPDFSPDFSRDENPTDELTATPHQADRSMSDRPPEVPPEAGNSAATPTISAFDARRLPKSTLFRHVRLSQQMLEDWVERENIALGNAIVCRAIGCVLRDGDLGDLG